MEHFIYIKNLKNKIIWIYLCQNKAYMAEDAKIKNLRIAMTIQQQTINELLDIVSLYEKKISSLNKIVDSYSIKNKERLN